MQRARAEMSQARMLCICCTDLASGPVSISTPWPKPDAGSPPSWVAKPAARQGRPCFRDNAFRNHGIDMTKGPLRAVETTSDADAAPTLAALEQACNDPSLPKHLLPLLQQARDA